MTEKGVPDPNGEFGQLAWDINAIANALRVIPESTADENLGQGATLWLGDNVSMTLELYPLHGRVRLRTAEAGVALSSMDQPVIADETIVFNKDTDELRVRLSVSAAASVHLDISPNAADIRPGGIIVHASDETVPGSNPVPTQAHAPRTPRTPKHQTPSTAPGQQEREKALTLTGRIGADPKFRTTPKGVLVVSFPLAVHSEDGKTVWHRIVTTKGRAEKLRDQVAKGQEVSVIGYAQTRELPAVDGQTNKTIHQLYAIAVSQKHHKPKLGAE